MTTTLRKRAHQPAHSDTDQALRRRDQTDEKDSVHLDDAAQAELAVTRSTPGLLRSALLGPDAGLRARVSSQLQGSQGNAFVQRLVQRDRALPEEASPDLSGLGVRLRKLPGHGQTGGGTPVTTGPGSGSPPSMGAVNASIHLSVNPASILRKTGREIASAHHRPGSAGWTTPAYTVTDPVVNGGSVTVGVTLDFIIELDSARQGEALAVISDHEQGHVHIGQNKAKQHLVNGFKSSLEALPRLTRSGYVNALNSAINNFVTEEGNDSHSYDAFDYPRMQLANAGAKASLSTLARRFPDIAVMASALRGYNREFVMATYGFNNIIIDDATIINSADKVIAATDAMNKDSINLLQYNRQFKALINNCTGLTNQYTTQKKYGSDMNNMLPSDENISAPVREKLQTLEASLGFFTWSAPV